MLQQIFSLSFMTAFLAAAVRLAVPLMYGGIGETIAEKSGILNIGMEGVMLSGAFFSFAGAWYSGNLFVGLLCGMAGGLVVSLLHGLLSITLIQNQSVSGLAINMLMLGVTSFLFKLMSNGQGYQQIETFPNIAIPGLSKIPLIGDAFFNCGFCCTWVFSHCHKGQPQIGFFVKNPGKDQENIKDISQEIAVKKCISDQRNL